MGQLNEKGRIKDMFFFLILFFQRWKIFLVVKGNKPKEK